MPEMFAGKTSEREVEYTIKLRKWRQRSPILRWRKAQGMTINEGATCLRMTDSSYTRIERGDSTPKLIYDKKTKALKGAHIMIRPKAGMPSVRTEWDEHIKPITGVTWANWYMWYTKKPKHPYGSSR